jgi:hypothetical protein
MIPLCGMASVKLKVFSCPGALYSDDYHHAVELAKLIKR